MLGSCPLFQPGARGGGRGWVFGETLDVALDLRVLEQPIRLRYGPLQVGERGFGSALAKVKPSEQGGGRRTEDAGLFTKLGWSMVREW